MMETAKKKADLAVEENPFSTLKVVILAATENRGMGSYHFEGRTRHLLPLGNKPLIKHLFDTLLLAVEETLLEEEKGLSLKRTKKVKKRLRENVFFLVSQNNANEYPCEAEYWNTFRNDFWNEALETEEQNRKEFVKKHLVGQSYLSQVGTFEAIFNWKQSYATTNDVPILVLFGDTIIQKEFLKDILKRYFRLWKKRVTVQRKSRDIIWGLFKGGKEWGPVSENEKKIYLRGGC